MRRRPPRRQACERHGDVRRPGQGSGLRSGAASWHRARVTGRRLGRSHADSPGNDRGYGGVHEPGTGSRRAGRSPDGLVLARRPAVPGRGRSPAVRGIHRSRDDRPDPPRSARLDGSAERRDSRRARPHHPEVPGEGGRPALPERAGAADRPGGAGPGGRGLDPRFGPRRSGLPQLPGGREQLRRKAARGGRARGPRRVGPPADADGLGRLWEDAPRPSARPACRVGVRGGRVVRRPDSDLGPGIAGRRGRARPGRGRERR